jgi:hypothetical protein
MLCREDYKKAESENYIASQHLKYRVKIQNRNNIYLAFNFHRAFFQSK